MAFIQADPAAKEWNEILPQTKSKFKYVRTFQKKGALLGEEKGKAGQVRLSGIHFCFRKIRIYSYGGQYICTNSLTGIQAGIEGGMITPIEPPEASTAAAKSER